MTITLKEMIARGIRYEHADGGWQRFRVPKIEPVELPDASLALDPYLMGTLLGDGSSSIGSPSIASAETELPWVDALPTGMTYRNSERRAGFCPQYVLTTGRRAGGRFRNPINTALRNVGLYGVKDRHKFIPESYLWGSVRQRWALLQGLCDTDGSNAKPGRVEFGTCSAQLAADVRQLTQSLGGAATIQVRQPKAGTKDRSVMYRVALQLNQKEAPFRLSRKVDAWSPRQHDVVRSIATVEPIEAAECVCILVEDSEHLFLTEGFIPTHNTHYETPLTRAMEIIGAYEKSGKPKPDVVFITDAECDVDDAFIEAWKDVKKRADVRCYGINIGGSGRYSAMDRLVDRCIQINQLNANPAAVTEMFRTI